MISSPLRSKASEQGFVIVAVLWILIALSSLAMIFALYLSASARAMAVSDTALQQEALASAAVELAGYQLTIVSDEARPAHGAFQFRMDDADVEVTFRSEAARLDLNFASKDVLAAFFTGLGAGKDAAMEDAERVVGWRSRPAPGATNDEEARYAALGYPPRQSLFMAINELALVSGLSPALVDRALPFVTIFNGSPSIDRSIAAPEVVAAFDKKAGAANDPFGAQMAASAGLSSTDPSAPPKSAAPAAKSSCYRIQMTIGFADGRRSAADVVIALGDKSEPYRVLAWQDDANPDTPLVRRRS